jgi:hypothetical protein
MSEPRGPGDGGRTRLAAAVLFLAGLTVLFFRKILLTNLILVGVDSFLYFYPYRAYVTESLLAGRFPFWNPHLFMGAPLFANMQTAVLYPLFWPLIGLFVPKQVAWSIALHVLLAATGTLLYARRSLRLGWVASLGVAVAFGMGGYLGAQVEHINQLSGMAWLPWVFLLLDGAAGHGTLFWRRRRSWAAMIGLGVVVALMILAGHAQTVYFAMVGAGVYGLVGGIGLESGSVPRGWQALWRWVVQRSLPYLLALAAAAVLAAALTAVQLLPTMELSGLSGRSGGLSYRDVTSFSLQPWRLHLTLLPPYGVDLSQMLGEAFSEYVAYVGIAGLVLALLGLWQRRAQPGTLSFALLAGLGLFLALGRYNPAYYVLYRLAPGFDLFRAPVRWMMLYAFGTAVLIGAGLESVTAVVRRRWGSAAGRRPFRAGDVAGVALLGVLCLELLVASHALRYNRPTAPEAYSSWRPSIAFLSAEAGLHRFLSLSGIVYDPGDLAEMRAIFADQLPEAAVYDYVVAAKEKEVLFYNLPLLYGFYSVDGYDGGVLPLRDFITLQRLFLPEDRLSVDGRLRENLDRVPEGKLLSWLGVKYVITDKVNDVWIDNIFYDLQFEARLGPAGEHAVAADGLRPFPSTAVGVVSYLEGAAELVDGTPVAAVTLADDSGWEETFVLRAGEETSQGVYVTGEVAHTQARVGHTWQRAGENGQVDGSDYITLLSLGTVRQLVSLRVESLLPAGEFVLRGVSLVDERTSTSQQALLSTEGRYRLVHSGDVKIYENLGVLPRAYVVGQAEVIPDADQALQRLGADDFDPARMVVLADGDALAGGGGGEAHITAHGAEGVTVSVETSEAAYLVLTDSFYPGWKAYVDGREAPVQRANVAFRAVALPDGAHEVVFRYMPTRFWWGVGISAAAWLLSLAVLVWVARLSSKRA